MKKFSFLAVDAITGWNVLDAHCQW